MLHANDPNDCTLTNLYKMVDDSIDDRINNLKQFKNNIKKIKNNCDISKCIFKPNDKSNKELEKLVAACKPINTHGHYETHPLGNGYTELHKLSAYICNVYIKHIDDVSDTLGQIKNCCYKMHEKSEALQILGGIYQNNWIEPEKIQKLAQIPGRVDLEAQLVGTIVQPLARLNNALTGNQRSLVYILSQYQISRQ